jgi:hypothetical protein
MILVWCKLFARRLELVLYSNIFRRLETKVVREKKRFQLLIKQKPEIIRIA